MTALRFRVVGEEPDERPRNPLFDPRRDGWPEQSLTARICGDPIPGRRELVATVDWVDPERRGLSP